MKLFTIVFLLLGIVDVADAQGACCSNLDCTSPQTCSGACCSCSTTAVGTCIDRTTTNVNLQCFSAETTVPVWNKGDVAMKDLAVGDQVYNPKGRNYEPVYAFAVREPEQETEFLQIFTSLEKPLEITPSHLIHVEGHAHPIRSASVQVGDVLYGDQDARLTVQKVESVVYQDGAYAPLTPSGQMFVNGIQASAYASLQKVRGEEYAELANGVLMPISQQTVIHMHLALYRMVCLGISSSFCDNATKDVTGKPLWVDWGMKLVDLADQQIVPVQVMMGIIYLLVVVPFYIMEVLFGSKFAPVVMFMAAFAAFTWRKKYRKEDFQKKTN